MENNFQMESQRSIAKSGYTSFANWMKSAVNQECQHINTDLGVIPFETRAWKIISKWKVNAASQNQGILLLPTGWKVLSIKNVNTSTLIWGSYPLKLEHGK
jgi:hypothetical protein